ncbi:hypothetical protein KUCAC02_012258, partial [Chaenocephalus aceratus]
MALKFHVEDCFLCLSLRCKVRKSRVKEATAPKNSCQPVGCHGAPLGVVKRPASAPVPLKALCRLLGIHMDRIGKLILYLSSVPDALRPVCHGSSVTESPWDTRHFLVDRKNRPAVCPPHRPLSLTLSLFHFINLPPHSSGNSLCGVPVHFYRSGITALSLQHFPELNKLSICLGKSLFFSPGL